MNINQQAMFTFGLFSTHLPYIIFLAAYVFYFITCTGGNVLDDNQANYPEKVIARESITVFTDTWYKGNYSRDQYCKHSGKISETFPANTIATGDSDLTWFIHGENNWVYLHDFAILSRPPPMAA